MLPQSLQDCPRGSPMRVEVARSSPNAPADAATDAPGATKIPEAVRGRSALSNQTSNQTSGGSLVSWPRLPRFGSFPFRFPFRGEKGSALSAGAPRGPGERRGHWVVFLQPPSSKKSSRPRRSGPKVSSGHHAKRALGCIPSPTPLFLH